MNFACTALALQWRCENLGFAQELRPALKFEILKQLRLQPKQLFLNPQHSRAGSRYICLRLRAGVLVLLLPSKDYPLAILVDRAWPQTLIWVAVMRKNAQPYLRHTLMNFDFPVHATRIARR